MTRDRRTQYDTTRWSSDMDWHLEDNARILAAQIQKFWRERGGDVDCWIEPLRGPNNGHAHGYQVRSNMSGGKPIARARQTQSPDYQAQVGELNIQPDRSAIGDLPQHRMWRP